MPRPARPGRATSHGRGLIVGKLGTAVFPIGDGTAIPAGATGRRYPSINDDMTGEYGVGFPDNEVTDL
jgi:hypothetical protein